MSQKSNILTNQGSPNQITDEYRVLHKVAQVLESSGSLMGVLQKAMQIITELRQLHCLQGLLEPMHTLLSLSYLSEF